MNDHNVEVVRIELIARRTIEQVAQDPHTVGNHRVPASGCRISGPVKDHINILYERYADD
eukprot:8818408-Pyramimonas_sp.AAC.2